MADISGDCRTETAAVLGRLLEALAAGDSVSDLTSGPAECAVTDSGVLFGDGDGVQTMPLVTCRKAHGIKGGELVVIAGGTYEGVTYPTQPVEDRPAEFYLLAPYSGDSPGNVWVPA
jgi:hypothetical protein